MNMLAKSFMGPGNRINRIIRAAMKIQKHAPERKARLKAMKARRKALKAALKKWQTKYESKREALSKMVGPHYVIGYSWGRAHNEDPWSIKGKMSFHGLYGYREKVEGYKLERYKLSRDDDLKFRMMNFWENCRTNKINCPEKRYKMHNVKFWRDEYYKHVVGLQMDQAQYEATSCLLFDKFAKTIDGLVKASSNDCYGKTGSRRFRVHHFLQEAKKSDYFPTVHIKDANIEIPKTYLRRLRGDTPRASKKVMEEVRMYVGMDMKAIKSPFQGEEPI